MQSDDTHPYQGPQAPVLGADPAINQLATRTARLGAAIVATIIMLAVMAPLMDFGGYFDAARAAVGSSMPLSTMLLWAMIGLVVFVAVRVVPLRASGQRCLHDLIAGTRVVRVG